MVVRRPLLRRALGGSRRRKLNRLRNRRSAESVLWCCALRRLLLICAGLLGCASVDDSKTAEAPLIGGAADTHAAVGAFITGNLAFCTGTLVVRTMS